MRDTLSRHNAMHHTAVCNCATRYSFHLDVGANVHTICTMHLWCNMECSVACKQRELVNPLFAFVVVVCTSMPSGADTNEMAQQSPNLCVHVLAQ